MASGNPVIPESLLKYESPLFVGESPSADVTKSSVKALPSDPAAQIDEIINSILPPRQWGDKEGVWMQYTSKNPSTRLDVIDLQENLERKLAERQARLSGICPVREDLYSQAFDELIREVTLSCPERGLLLMRVKDEIRMRIDAYRALYESSVVFGIRKQMQAEIGMDDMEQRIAALEAQKKNLETNVLELRNKVEVTEKRENERRALEEKRRREEIEFLKYQGQHLDAFLKSLTNSK